MTVLDEKTETGDLIFEAAFHDVQAGVYQYKIRIGEHEWVVDEGKRTGKVNV